MIDKRKKKDYPVVPMATLKQKAAIEKIIENHGNVSRAMLDVGYDPTTAKNPSNLTNSKAWPELMEKYLPDDKVLLVHQEGLEANKVISAKIVGKDADGNTDDFIEVPDHPTRLKAVELAYKVKNKFGAAIQILNQGEMDIEFISNEK